MAGISIIQLSPLPRDMRPGWRHRHLGLSAWDQGGEDDPESGRYEGPGCDSKCVWIESAEPTPLDATADATDGATSRNVHLPRAR
jgi:hypothetical protein